MGQKRIRVEMMMIRTRALSRCYRYPQGVRLASSTSAFDNVLTETRERVGIVTLNRPKVSQPIPPRRNHLSTPFVETRLYPLGSREVD